MNNSRFVRRILWCCIFVALAATHVLAAEKETVSPYLCNRAEGGIVIDGKLDETAWAKAPVIKLLVPVANETPISKTEGRVLWDDKYIYVGFKAYDEDIWSYFTNRDSQTCCEDVLEFFFSTTPNKEPFFNFEVNAIGTIYDAYNIKRGAGGNDLIIHRWCMWNCEGAKTATYTDGTLNNHEDTDHYWQLELAVPFAELPTLKGKTPQGGDIWTFQLARYDYSIYLPGGQELSSSAKLSVLNFHWFEDWAPLKFVK